MVPGPLRIALIAHHVAPIAAPFAGGVESFTWYLARWLGRRGHEVVMFAPPGSAVPGVEVRELDLAPDLSDAARTDVSMPAEPVVAAHHAYLRLMLELAVDAEGFDLIHSNSLHYLPVAMAPSVPIPSLLTLHTPPTPWLESALRARLGVAPPVLNAVSEATRALWAPVVAVDDVVHNGVDLEAWPVGPGGPDAVWSGRMVAEKAPHLAIDAAARAGMTLRLAGPISDRAYFDREVAPRLGRGAEYLGHLDHDALAQVVGASRVAVLSPAWEEPFGLVAAEAMATGTPVASFACGGLPRVVGPPGGRLAAPGDVDGLADAMRRAAGLPRDGVRAHARDELGLDAMGHAYEALYARTLAGAAPPDRLLQSA